MSTQTQTQTQTQIQTNSYFPSQKLIRITYVMRTFECKGGSAGTHFGVMGGGAHIGSAHTNCRDGSSVHIQKQSSVLVDT
jgi:hypothetical protein